MSVITECKVVKLEKDLCFVPAYELLCPYCKQKLVIETDLVKHVSNVYCFYCHQILERKIFEKN